MFRNIGIGLSKSTASGRLMDVCDVSSLSGMDASGYVCNPKTRGPDIQASHWPVGRRAGGQGELLPLVR